MLFLITTGSRSVVRRRKKAPPREPIRLEPRELIR